MKTQTKSKTIREVDQSLYFANENAKCTPSSMSSPFSSMTTLAPSYHLLTGNSISNKKCLHFDSQPINFTTPKTVKVKLFTTPPTPKKIRKFCKCVENSMKVNALEKIKI